MVPQALDSLSNSPECLQEFQILSDLHLEVNREYDSFEIPVCSKYLILAGDIGRLVDYDEYLAFLEKQTRKFQTVFLVLGNHEFYGLSFDSALEKARKLEQEPSLKGRLVWLHQHRVDIPDSKISILGCVLWSHIPENTKEIVSSRTKDFKHIQNWTANQHNVVHTSDLTWLRRELDNIHHENLKKPSETRSVLVITHHAPSLQGTSNPKYENSPWSSAFATDLLSQGLDGVNTWVFGHTHYSTEFNRNGILAVSNQRGYIISQNNEPVGFDPKKVIRV
ncbi:calcineurin-like phosphoesterase [Penicillium waksmanii]|uniref:calcineurin-like phosphoesterase n=1 Tax=Penicillium waksmanii TaxID=69791 RepID=UPI002547B646|nr:calcineurin-like phosphoesterase [Penicillium waksmanii]KAJ5995036.1 calcineurin-like phosphoesterase [Penicillium waksmanii]